MTTGIQITENTKRMLKKYILANKRVILGDSPKRRFVSWNDAISYLLEHDELDDELEND